MNKFVTYTDKVYIVFQNVFGVMFSHGRLEYEMTYKRKVSNT